MDQIKQHLGPQGPTFYQNSGFRGFEGFWGGWGHHQSTRDEKHAPGLIFVNFGWIYEGFVPIFDFW